MKTKITYYLILAVTVLACKTDNTAKTGSAGLHVVTTTSLITEMITVIGGNALVVNGLMGAGVDPHLYKASEGDVNKLYNADVIFYNGLHLEGKIQDVLENMKKQGIEVVPLADTLSSDRLIASSNFASNYDPHIWFSISCWKIAAQYAANKLSSIDPANKQIYQANVMKYIARLDSTERLVLERINELPVERRVLITAHDAFNYFGKAYDFEVLGLQGISTVAEAGVQDVQNLAGMITERKIKAIFVESSVPRRNIEALQEAVRSKGFDVQIGGSLYSDALGTAGTKEGTYPGMFLYNVNTIVRALKD